MGCLFCYRQLLSVLPLIELYRRFTLIVGGAAFTRIATVATNLAAFLFTGPPDELERDDNRDQEQRDYLLQSVVHSLLYKLIGEQGA